MFPSCPHRKSFFSERYTFLTLLVSTKAAYLAFGMIAIAAIDVTVEEHMQDAATLPFRFHV